MNDDERQELAAHVAMGLAAMDRGRWADAESELLFLDRRFPGAVDDGVMELRDRILDRLGGDSSGPVDLDVATSPVELKRLARVIELRPDIPTDVKVRLTFYADTKADALKAKAAGLERIAREREADCARVYRGLPDQWKW
jgi:hypothetical protein